MTTRSRLLRVLLLAVALPCAHGQTPSAGPIPLTSLPVQTNAQAKNLSGCLFADRSPEGAPVPLGDFAAAAEAGRGYLGQDLKRRSALSLGDRTYTHGLLALHGSVSWAYALAGRFAGLTAEVGNFDRGHGTLRLLGDGRLLYDSGRLLNNKPTPLLADLRGVQELTLVWSDPGVATQDYSVIYNATLVVGNPTLTPDPRPGLAATPGPDAKNQPPVARITATPAVGQAPLEVAFTGSTSTDADGQVGRYTWHFGDGEVETLLPDPSHTFTAPGLYHVVLLAEDDRNGVGLTSTVVTVRPPLNQPPVAELQVSARVASPGTALRFDASASTDPDGAVASYAWDFGDGQTATGATPVHAYAASGRYDVTLTVTDQQGEQTVRTLSVRSATPEQLARPFPLGQGARVLVVGNSLTSFNGTIPTWLVALDAHSPDPLGLVAGNAGKGMGTLEEYATWDRLGIHAKIDQGWDVVLIQPWTEVLDPKVSFEDLLKHAGTLVGWVRASGAYPVFYEPQVWWVLGFKAEQKTTHERILQLAEKLDAGFIPAGTAWLAVEKDYPLPLSPDGSRGLSNSDPLSFNNLMFSDTGHQNQNGSLFNSMMVWKYLSSRSPREAKLGPEMKFNPHHLEKVRWDLVPYFATQAEAAVSPAAERLR